jgi:uncharacterized protein YbjT (DUF2867 family)
MRIVINTPNGNIGRPLTERLLDAGAQVTLITRRPESVADFVARGARLVEGSIDDPSVVGRALEGADALFWLTPPIYRPDASEWATGAAATAAGIAKRLGVRRVVVLSSIGAQSGPGTGPVGWLLAVEDAFRAGVPDVVALRPGFLMENLLLDIPTIRDQGVLYSPTPTDKPFPLVASVDVAARAAAFLLDSTQKGHVNVGVHGPADLPYRRIAEVLSAALGRSIRHVETTLEQTRQAMLAAQRPEFVADLYVEMFRAIREGRMDPAEPRTASTTTATTLTEFATRVLSPKLTEERGDVTLATRASEVMSAWEHGDTDLYRKRLAPGARMTIPAYGLDIAGFEAIWEVRKSMKPLAAGPLGIHVLTSHTVDGRSVRAVSHVISRETGQFTQHANVRFDFDAHGRVEHYHQDVVWMAK